ncbi:MAG TPA: tetratricopeptide repeat protein [Pyrinomonadaceae bacterium]|nr:tetratricopeptide repeat protein [Pyrinomonadaceae bacterium]
MPDNNSADPKPKRFRIAFSFAGEKRDFAAKVARILADRFGEDKILYDKFHKAEFSQANLAFDLPKLYHDSTELIVAVFCPDYPNKEWCGLAEAERLSGSLDAAERDYREGLRIAHVVEYQEGGAIVTGNLALLALSRDDWRGAEELAREALALAGKVGRLELIAGNCRRLAKALVRQGKKQEAFRHAGRAVEIYQKLGSPKLAAAQQILAECESS